MKLITDLIVLYFTANKYAKITYVNSAATAKLKAVVP
jgi:hypothetical protein